MSSETLWERVVLGWRRSGLAIRPGASPAEVASFECRYAVVLPADVRQYFSTVDGMEDELDEGLYRFWPLSEVQPVADLPIADSSFHRYRDAYSDCFAFADHCIRCWDYAFRLTDDPHQSAPVFRVTFADPPGEQMAPSFHEFMQRYVADPDSIL